MVFSRLAMRSHLARKTEAKVISGTPAYQTGLTPTPAPPTLRSWASQDLFNTAAFTELYLRKLAPLHSLQRSLGKPSSGIRPSSPTVLRY